MDRVAVDHLVDLGFGVAAFAHFEGGAGDGEGNANAPVAGAVHPDLIEAIHVEDVDGAGGGAFGFGVEGHARPEAGVFDDFDGVFFDVVDDAAFGFDAAIVFEDVDDEARAFEFVFEVRGVDEDELVVARGEVNVFFEDGDFVAGILVEADFADAENGGAFEERRDEMEDVFGEGDVFGFLRVDAEPGVVLEAEFGGAFGFVFGELEEVIVEAIRAAAIEAGPESGFANGFATGEGHGLVIVGGAADHVAVRFDVAHGSGLLVGFARTVFSRSWISARSGFGGCSGDRVFSWVAEAQENFFGAIFFVVEDGKGSAKGFHAKIFFAFGAIDAIDERGDVEQLGAGVHEVKVQNLLACHTDLQRGDFGIEERDWELRLMCFEFDTFQNNAERFIVPSGLEG